MKRILLGLVLSPLLVLASPQNLANISDLKESIALMIDRLDTLEQEMDTFKQDLQSSKKENKQEEGKNKIKEESKTPENEAATYSDKKVDELQNEMDKLKEEFANMTNNDSSRNLQGDKPDKEDSDKDKGNNNQTPNINLQNQYKDFTVYVNKKIEELENRIISSSSLKSNSSSLSPSSSVQNNKSECDYNCVSKADFSNYKFERVKKEKYLQEQIDVLRKQIEELNKHLQEIKSYYEGS